MIDRRLRDKPMVSVLPRVAQLTPTGMKPVTPADMMRRRTGWQNLWKHSPGMIGLVGSVLLLAVVALAPSVAPFDPTMMDYEHLLEPPSRTHVFGTDDLGRDVLSRVLWGGRESLRVALLALTAAAFGGSLLGLVSGYFGGWMDGVIMRVVDVFLAFPPMLLALGIVAALGPNLSTVLLALSTSAIPRVTRFVRGTVLATKHREYVTAAQAVGATSAGILFTHILPNIAPPLIVYCALGLGSLIMATAGLSYLGLGAQPPSPEWGAMLSAGREYLRDAWWMSIFPGLGIFLTVLFIKLDPKLRV
jgi:ABC-type dipeptide/oligopeptide/nickel transport system permease subunit